jgi:hypothetical protein
MSAYAQYEADRGDGSNIDGASSVQQPSFAAQLRNTLNTIPVYTWYAVPSGGLAFVNERCADYLGLPRNHPLRFGTHTGAEWDSHIPLLHPDDHEETRSVWSNCLSNPCHEVVVITVNFGPEKAGIGGSTQSLTNSEEGKTRQGATTGAGLT